jgi:hypothetical protein
MQSMPQIEKAEFDSYHQRRKRKIKSNRFYRFLAKMAKTEKRKEKGRW